MTQGSEQTHVPGSSPEITNLAALSPGQRQDCFASVGYSSDGECDGSSVDVIASFDFDTGMGTGRREAWAHKSKGRHKVPK